MRLERVWWCLPAAVLCAADGLLTLWGQPAAYWSGDYAVVNEGHPMAAWFLSRHPLAFAAAGVPYLLLVALVVACLPRPWALLAAVGVAAGHAVGAAMWCWILFPQPAVGLVPLAILVAGSGRFAWQRGEGRPCPG
jgi:hypothetical protein